MALLVLSMNTSSRCCYHLIVSWNSRPRVAQSYIRPINALMTHTARIGDTRVLTIRLDFSHVLLAR